MFKKCFWVCGSGGVFESCTFYLHDGRANRGCRLSCTVRTPSLGHVEARGRIETPGEHTLDAQLRIQLHLRKIQQPRLPTVVGKCCCRVLLPRTAVDDKCLIEQSPSRQKYLCSPTGLQYELWYVQGATPVKQKWVNCLKELKTPLFKN